MEIPQGKAWKIAENDDNGNEINPNEAVMDKFGNFFYRGSGKFAYNISGDGTRRSYLADLKS